jgi:hypothetical protein
MGKRRNVKRGSGFWADGYPGDTKSVKVDTEDGQLTVRACVLCGMLDPDLNPQIHECFFILKEKSE